MTSAHAIAAAKKPRQAEKPCTSPRHFHLRTLDQPMPTAHSVTRTKRAISSPPDASRRGESFRKSSSPSSATAGTQRTREATCGTEAQARAVRHVSLSALPPSQRPVMATSWAPK